jgi:hypothetical protein
MGGTTNEAIQSVITNGVTRLEQIRGTIERAAREAAEVIEQTRAQAAVLGDHVELFEGRPAIVFSGYAQDFRVWEALETAEVRIFPGMNGQHLTRRVTGDGKLDSGDYAVVVALIPVATRKAVPLKTSQSSVL